MPPPISHMPDQFDKMSPSIAIRCINCRMHINLCICELMPRLTLKTKLTIFMQRKELSITSNTAHFLPKLIEGTRIRFRGNYDKSPADTSGLMDDNLIPLVLFPSTKAVELSPEWVAALTRPAHLIVLDGNWVQTKKMLKRIPLLQTLQHVKLGDLGDTQYKLRKGPGKNHYCTFEAAAKALGILESPDIEAQMTTFFTEMVNRVLWTRTLFDWPQWKREQRT